MINLAEVEYLNSCFTQEEPKVTPSSPCDVSEAGEELVNDFAEAISEAFEGFVLTVVNSKGEQYTASNVDPVSALKMIDSALDALQEEAWGCLLVV